MAAKPNKNKYKQRGITMNTYVGIKTVKAEPYRAWRNMGKYKMGETGYKVSYPNGNEGWSPQAVFEEEYKRLPDNNSELTNTLKLMISSDYQDRFIAEYLQLTIRIEKLSKMLKSYKAGTLSFKPTCSYELLNRQLEHMKLYQQDLEERAEIENINLASIIKEE